MEEDLVEHLQFPFPPEENEFKEFDEELTGDEDVNQEDEENIQPHNESDEEE